MIPQWLGPKIRENLPPCVAESHRLDPADTTICFASRPRSPLGFFRQRYESNSSFTQAQTLLRGNNSRNFQLLLTKTAHGDRGSCRWTESASSLDHDWNWFGRENDAGMLRTGRCDTIVQGVEHVVTRVFMPFGWCEPRLRSQTAEGRREVAADNAPGGVCGAEEPGWQNRAFCGPGQFPHDPLDIEHVGRPALREMSRRRSGGGGLATGHGFS